MPSHAISYNRYAYSICIWDRLSAAAKIALPHTAILQCAVKFYTMGILSPITTLVDDLLSLVLGLLGSIPGLGSVTGSL